MRDGRDRRGSDASFYGMDASKRGGGRQRKKTDFASVKVLLDGCGEWYHRRRISNAEVLRAGRLERSNAAPVHEFAKLAHEVLCS